MNLVAVCFVAVTEGYIIFDSWELRCIIAYGINNLAVNICDLHNDYSLTQICCVFDCVRLCSCYLQCGSCPVSTK